MTRAAEEGLDGLAAIVQKPAIRPDACRDQRRPAATPFFRILHRRASALAVFARRRR